MICRFGELLSDIIERAICASAFTLWNDQRLDIQGNARFICNVLWPHRFHPLIAKRITRFKT